MSSGKCRTDTFFPHSFFEYQNINYPVSSPAVIFTHWTENSSVRLSDGICFPRLQTRSFADGQWSILGALKYRWRRLEKKKLVFFWWEQYNVLALLWLAGVFSSFEPLLLVIYCILTRSLTPSPSFIVWHHCIDLPPGESSLPGTQLCARCPSSIHIWYTTSNCSF